MKPRFTGGKREGMFSLIDLLRFRAESPPYHSLG